LSDTVTVVAAPAAKLPLVALRLTQLAVLLAVQLSVVPPLLVSV
jgi:hypothetical protein